MAKKAWIFGSIALFLAILFTSLAKYLCNPKDKNEKQIGQEPSAENNGEDIEMENISESQLEEEKDETSVKPTIEDNDDSAPKL